MVDVIDVSGMKPRGELFLASDSDVDLESIVVRAEAQRRGIGSRLLELGLVRADADHESCFLYATPAGYPLYLRYEFVEIDRIDVDLSRWYGVNKGYGVWRNTFMIRLPTSGKAT